MAVQSLTCTPGPNVTLATWGKIEAYKIGHLLIVTGYGAKFSAASGNLVTISGISVSKYMTANGFVEGSSDRSFLLTASPTNTNVISYESVKNLNSNGYFEIILLID